MKKIICVVFLCLFIGGNLTLAVAQELPVDKIVEKANLASYYAGNDGLSDVVMTIKDSQGRERIRDFRILRMTLKEGGEQKFYVYFRKPTDVSKMVYMVWKNIGRDDDRWLYLPALDLVRRIASSDKRSSFVGSHFVYEDVSGRGVEADSHELLSTEGGIHKIKNTPKEASSIEFSYYLVWVREDNFLPVKAEYYDDKDKLIRSIEAVTIEDIQGYPTVTKSLAKDFVRGGETTMEFKNTKYDSGLTDDIFAERYLRRAPTQWIK
ncbi:outer membrane lipoprotein-sorting protein [Thermoproteota archaeon]